jgi:NAD+ synthase
MSNFSQRYEKEILNFDIDEEVESICRQMRQSMRDELHRRGAVVAVSGGIDSSVCAALSVRAFGPKKSFLIQLPEIDSATQTQSRSDQLISFLGTDHTRLNIGPALEAIGCYEARDQAIMRVFPEFNSNWKSKIVLKGGTEGKINHFLLVAQKPDGDILEERLSIREYLQIVAATNYKQRIRKTVEYFHADRLNYAVIGTPNRLEYDQGFFVKNGDGSADFKPIAHLYKTQVYAMARHLGLPDSICDAEPTTDTYSMPQGQDEFYFGLPYKQMDAALWAHNNNYPAEDLSDYLGITPSQATYVYNDIETKRKTTSYLHKKAILVEDIF